MSRMLRSTKAQGISAEYVILIFLVVGALVGMSTYVRRTLQARSFDINALVVAKAALALYTPVQVEYEPYYTTSTTMTDTDTKATEKAVTAGYQKDTSTQRLIVSNSSQAAPQ